MVDPSFLEIAHGVESTASAHGYNLMLAGTSEASELATIQRMKAAGDGLILADPWIDDDQLREMSRDTPIVVINRETDEVACVVPDVKKEVREAIRNLRGNGHRKVAFLSGSKASWMSMRISEEVQDACEWSGMETIGIAACEPTIEGGRRIAPNVIASGVTAVMTGNDLLAIGLMHELQAASIPVPDRISIIGFGDTFGVIFTSPQLTTMRYPREKSGALAVKSLVGMLQGDQEQTHTVHMETELVLRGSTGRHTYSTAPLE
jgi:DNA-binding LacI/PurR family transcriptional regulator